MSDDEAVDFLLELRDLVNRGLVQIAPRKDGADGFRPTSSGQHARAEAALVAPDDLPAYQVRDE